MEEQITPEELKKELEEVKVQRDEYLAGWQRARADFLNHKKEERERMQEFIKFAEEELLGELLPIVDNLEIALAHLKPAESPQGIQAGPPQSSAAGLGGEDAVSKGFSQIAMQIKSFLKDHQVEEVKAGGEKFNPEFHEAAEEVEKEGVGSGIIVEVLSKGYTLHGKLMRPAKVIVAK
jgi:molecular chaperone GrpE